MRVGQRLTHDHIEQALAAIAELHEHANFFEGFRANHVGVDGWTPPSRRGHDLTVGWLLAVSAVSSFVPV